MKLWYFLLDERFITITNLVNKKEYRELDGIGFMLEYDDTDERIKDPNFIRRHLVGVRSTHTIIEADTKVEAIKTFHREWEGAKVGTKAKALWIRDKPNIDPVREVPRCDLRHKNGRGEYICGEVDPYGDGNCGELGMCVLEGYDPPEDCPLAGGF